MIYVLIFLVFILGIHVFLFLKMKKKDVIQFIQNDELNHACSKIGDNICVCKEILEDLNNINTSIQLNENKKSENSYYDVFNNNIVLCDNEKINASFARILYISHECQHSIQNKKVLIYNFVIACINMIYIIVLAIMTIFKCVDNNVLIPCIIISIVLNVFSALTRIIIESDATYMSIFNAQNFLNKHIDIEEAKNIIKQYSNMISKGYSTFITSVVLKNIIILIIQIVLLIIVSR